MLDTKMKLSDEEIKAIDKEYCSWGDTVHYHDDQTIFRDCEGSYMYDGNDTPYLDLQMWYSSCNLGYKNKRILDAVLDQYQTMPQISSRFVYDYKALLAEKVAKANFERYGIKGRVQFNVGGAQVNEDMLKLVRNYTKKPRMFAFMGGYHGRTLGTTAVTSSYRYREHFGHMSDTAHFVPFPYCFRCHYGKNCETCGMYCVKQFAKLFESEYNAVYDPNTKDCEFGGFIAEPLLGTGGYIVPPKGYFKELKKVLDDHNILFMVDEVQMGCFRTGKLWAMEHFGVQPDAMTFAKSITNGMNPLAGMWAKEELINPKVFPAGRTHSTYAANPIGTRAGYEVMSIFEEQREILEKEIARKGEKFLDGLKALEKKYKNIGTVNGLGFALSVEVTEADGYAPAKKLCDDIIEAGLKGDLTYKGKKCGLILNNGGYFKNIITLVPQLFISDEEIDMALELMDQLFERYMEKA